VKRNVVLDTKTRRFRQEKKKVGNKKPLAFKVEREVGDAFWEFCNQKLNIKPYRLLENIINFYGRSYIITKKADKGELSNEDTFIELGKILSDMKELAHANGEFQATLQEVCKPYGINAGAFKIT